jgi:hypothetical protein
VIPRKLIGSGGELLVRASLHPLALLLVVWKSYVTPSQPEFTKTNTTSRWKLSLFD